MVLILGTTNQLVHNYMELYYFIGLRSCVHYCYCQTEIESHNFLHMGRTAYTI